jgi:hypothetical protein
LSARRFAPSQLAVFDGFQLVGGRTFVSEGDMPVPEERLTTCVTAVTLILGLYTQIVKKV